MQSAETLQQVLPDLWPTLSRIAAALSPHGPPSITIQTSVDHQLVSLFLRILIGSPTRHHTTVFPAFVVIDCIEIGEPKQLYDRILNTLSAWPLTYNETWQGVENWDGRGADCLTRRGSRRELPWRPDTVSPHDEMKGVLGTHVNETFATFASALEMLLKLEPGRVETAGRRMIALLHAEHLSTRLSGRGDVPLKAAFDRLAQNVLGHDLAIVYVTEAGATRLSTGAPMTAPHVMLQLRPLSQTENASLFSLYLGRPGPHDPDRHPLHPASSATTTYGALSVHDRQILCQSLIEQTFQALSRSVAAADVQRSLSIVCTAVWPHWIAPVLHGTVQCTETSRLVAATKAVMSEHVNRLYTFGMPSQKRASRSATLTMALPTSARVVLLATFLACYNPPRTDLKLFGSTSDGTRRKAKRRRLSPTKQQASQHLLGPKAASIERIQALYEVLLDHIDLGRSHSDPGAYRVTLLRGADADFHMQMASLVAKKLVSRSGPERLDVYKVKVAIEREEAAALATKLGLTALDDWLYDSNA